MKEQDTVDESVHDGMHGINRKLGQMLMSI